MRKIKEVLRLRYEAKLSCRQIAASLKLSVGVISKYTQAAEAAGLSWPLPDSMDETPRWKHDYFLWLHPFVSTPCLTARICIRNSSARA